MSLSAAQTRILRDMADGARLRRGWTGLRLHAPGGRYSEPVSASVLAHLLESGLIVKRDAYLYALTPAGAAAAGEGAE